MHLKQVTEDDWQVIEKLEQASAHPYFAACKGEEGYRKYIRKSTMYVIMVEDEAIGTISYEESSENSFLINGLTVLPAHRKKGIGRSAMEKIMEELEGAKLSLFVHPKNSPALMLYLSLGFTIEEWRENVFGEGEHRLFLVK